MTVALNVFVVKIAYTGRDRQTNRLTIRPTAALHHVRRVTPLRYMCGTRKHRKTEKNLREQRSIQSNLFITARELES